MRPILLKGHDGPLTCVKYNRDGDLVFSTCRRGRICVWYSDDGERLGTYNSGGKPGAVMQVDVNYHCDKLAAASMDQTGRIWDVETGKILREWKLDAGARGVSIALGDKRVAVLQDPFGDTPSCVKIFDIESFSEEPVQTIQMDYGCPKATRAMFGPSNERLIVSTEGGALLSYDVASGECIDERCDVEMEIPDITFSTDQMLFIAACKDNTATLYDTTTLEPLKTYKSDRPINSAAISPLMDHVVLGGGQSAADVTTTSSRAGKFQALFYHKIYETEVGKVGGHFGPINSLMFNPDGRSFVSGGEDGYLRIHHFDPEYYSLEQ
ncbi:quinon protein alcohol dehydrogenase-like superfamily [Baffinella frigidus]|nr:quinon protein alcohol dehydrogenase-like superfamily [Cryptophyta sp. CCMP2293]